MTLDAALRAELLAMIATDDEVRARLVAEGVLYDGYHADMERVHRANGEALHAIMRARGWPGRSLVGDDGAAAAWRIAQHAISCPAVQRDALALLRVAVEQDDAPARHRAYLTDRVRFNERRPQRYGTIFDWDANGVMSPWQIEDPSAVDALRRDVGLPPLDDATREIRRTADAEGAVPPDDFAAHVARAEAWARSVGWR